MHGFLFAERLGDAVKDDRQKHDADATGGCRPHIEATEAGVDGEAEPASADQCCNDHHRQSQHQGLIETRHDGAQGQWKLNLPQHLPACGAEGFRSFDQVTAHIADAQIGEADNGWKRKDDRGDDARHHSHTEQHDNRHQINEGRDRLHDVQNRSHDEENAVAACTPDAERNADYGAEQHRGDDHRQGGHGLRPEPDHVYEREGDQRENSNPAARRTPGNQREACGKHQHGQPVEERIEPAENGRDRCLHGAEEGTEIGHQEIANKTVHPVVERDLNEIGRADHWRSPFCAELASVSSVVGCASSFSSPES